jgi:hypothetical protein
MAGCVKTIQINLGIIEVAKPRESCAKIQAATKIRILFFYPSTVGCSQGKENRQLEKPHSTLKGGRAVHCFSDFFIFSSWLKVRPTVVYPFLRK